MGNEQALAVVGASQSLVGRSAQLLEPSSIKELEQLGQLMASSGFFTDARGAAQACVKILAGREMGIPPIASMVGISIIEGKPATGANLLAACMKRAGYTWTVQQRDAKGCKLTVFFREKEMGTSEFLEEDAKRAELLSKKNWQRYPRSMYFARTISDAARTYASEVLAGLPAYTAEELGAENTTEDGSLIIEVKPESHADVAARRIAEERAKITQQASAPDGWFETMLGHFASMKESLGDDAYYRILGAHNVKHANEFSGGDAARVCYKAMLAEVEAIKKQKEAA